MDVGGGGGCSDLVQGQHMFSFDKVKSCKSQKESRMYEIEHQRHA